MTYRDYLAKIDINGRTLYIIYNKMIEGLHSLGEVLPDNEVCVFIKDNIDIAYDYAINKNDEGSFVLNIASYENFGEFDWDGDPWSDSLLKRQLEIYKPLIQKFMIDAMNGSL